MPQHIPHELEDLILQHLRYDSTALRETALSCYRFAVVCQKLLFTSILLDLTLGQVPEALRRFLEAAPHIANSIRGIDVIADSYCLYNIDTALLPCLSLLGSLRHMSIDTTSTRPIYWRYLSPATRSALGDVAHSNRLVTLRLRRVFEVPLSLLAECSSLEALSLCSIAFQKEDIQRILDGGWALRPSNQMPRLRTLQLSISDDAFRTLLIFLIGSSALLDISGLAELSISIFSPRFDYTNIGRLLQAVGDSLQIFCFSPMIADFPGIHSRGEQFSSIRLQVLTHLQIFRLRLVADRAYKVKTTFPLFKDCASSVLNQLSPDHALEELSIKTALSESQEFKGDDSAAVPPWTDVDDALSKITTLRKMTLIIFRHSSLHPKMMPRIKNALPNIAGSNVVFSVQEATSPMGFLENANDADLLKDTFRRHNMD